MTPVQRRQVPAPACVRTYGGRNGVAPSPANHESPDVTATAVDALGRSDADTATAPLTNYILLLVCSSSTAQTKLKVRLVGGGHRV